MPCLSMAEKAALRQSLLKNVGALVAELMPSKPIRESAHELRVGNRGSISIDRRSGLWFAHDGGEGGDLFAFIQYATGCSFPEAIVFAKSWAGTASTRRNSPPPITRTTDEARAKLSHEAALRLWKHGTRPMDESANPVSAYLNRRSIVRDVWPADLRYHPNLHHFATGKYHPAMVCAFRDMAGEVQAIHRTYLTHDGNKLCGEGINAKLNLASPKGCAIRLAPATDKVALCEGIEDALTIIQETDWPCWAVGNAAGLYGVVLPDAIREVMICADADDVGIRAAQKAAERFMRQNRKATIAKPYGAKDFNEMMMRQKRDA